MTAVAGAFRSESARRAHVDLRAAAVRLGVCLEWDGTPNGLAPGATRVRLGTEEGLANLDDAETIRQAEALVQAFPWLDIAIQAGLS